MGVVFLQGVVLKVSRDLSGFRNLTGLFKNYFDIGFGF